ncbi:hypothetical protein HEO39_004400 [Escherichia coli]|nr:hypothetical protein [Escherichia coli]
MFPSSNFFSALKMTALSVIFFVFPTACSVAAFSNDDSLSYENDAAYQLPLNPFDTSIPSISSPLVLSGIPNEGLMVCEKPFNSFHKLSLANKNNENVLVNHYKNTPESHEIFNIVKVPESGPEWVSICISILALISSFGIPYFQHRKERNEAINEGYWLREVIMPKINGLAFEVATEFKNAMPLAEDDFINALNDNLLPKLGGLRDSLYLFESFPKLNQDVETLEGICDTLEEKVSDNINLPIEARMADISRFHSSLIQNLILLHRKVG